MFAGSVATKESSRYIAGSDTVKSLTKCEIVSATNTAKESTTTICHERLNSLCGRIESIRGLPGPKLICAQEKTRFECSYQNPHYCDCHVLLDLNYRMKKIHKNLLCRNFNESFLVFGYAMVNQTKIESKVYYPKMDLSLPTKLVYERIQQTNQIYRFRKRDNFCRRFQAAFRDPPMVWWNLCPFPRPRDLRPAEVRPRSSRCLATGLTNHCVSGFFRMVE